MEETEKPVLLKTFIIISLIVLVEAGAYIYTNMPSSFSGHIITDLTEVYSNLGSPSKLFLYIQWAVMGLILIMVFFKNKGILKRKEEKIGINMKELQKNSKTDLDSLYLLLKKKNQLSIKSISDLFKINEELAIEWAKILEAGGLARMDYPGFGSPTLQIVEETKSMEKSEMNNLLEEDKSQNNDDKKVNIITKKTSSQKNQKITSRKIHSKIVMGRSSIKHPKLHRKLININNQIKKLDKKIKRSKSK